MFNFAEQAWKDYVSCQQEDKKTLNHLNRLIEDIKRNPFEGIGKPEPLKYRYLGLGLVETQIG